MVFARRDTTRAGVPLVALGNQRAGLRAHGGALRYRRRACRCGSGRVVRAARPRDGGTAGCRGPRKPRPRARGNPELRVRLPAAARHGQSRAGRRPQGGSGVRSADCAGRSGRLRRGRPSRRFPTSWSLASCRWMARCIRRAGVLPIAATARRAGYQRLLVPSANALEAAVVTGTRRAAGRFADRSGRRAQRIPIVGARCRRPRHRRPGQRRARPCRRPRPGRSPVARSRSPRPADTTCLFVGPPGAGKTMMARRLPGLLPPLSFEEALEVTTVHSVAGLSPGRRRPDSHTALSRASPHHLRHGARRRRFAAASWRDQPGAPRRALPRRTPGVLPARAGSAAAAGRTRNDRDRTCGTDRGVPCALHAGRRDEPVPVRVLWRPPSRLQMCGATRGALRESPVRSAPRPPRPRRTCRRSGRLGSGSRGIRRVVRHGARARARRASAASEPPAGRAECAP